ncbi:hypothetical protein [Rhizohabitans arisaemae]|uniref:hypothetical protein n=1 Tax=Rhizohabitans arisaemae TaxID=2720610 RepID=UPI0024B27AF6|nr:hypothetical protein [Rhizohabitans arisaemae]
MHRLRRPLALLSTLLLALVVSGTLPTAASASGPEVTCTLPSSNIVTYNPPLSSTPQSVTVTTTYQYSSCVSTTQPGLTSGTRTTVSTQTRSCPDLLTNGTFTLTINWNTGQSSTATGSYSAVSAGVAIVLTLTGTVTSGLFTGSNFLQVNTAPSAEVLLCTAGLGTLSGLGSQVSLQITS